MAQKPPSPKQISYLKSLAAKTGQSFNPAALKFSVAAHYEITRLKAVVEAVSPNPVVATTKLREQADWDRQIGVQVFADDPYEVMTTYSPEIRSDEVTEGSFSEISFDHTPKNDPTFSSDDDGGFASTYDGFSSLDMVGSMSESPTERRKRERAEKSTEFYCG